MTRNKSGAPVVIVRKHKKTHWLLHAVTFGLTGGLSAPLNAAVVARNASYNLTTRKLAEDAEPPAPARRGRRGKVTFTDEELAYFKAHTPKR